MANGDAGATLIGCDRVPTFSSASVGKARTTATKAQKRSRAEQTENGQQLADDASAARNRPEGRACGLAVWRWPQLGRADIRSLSDCPADWPAR